MQHRVGIVGSGGREAALVEAYSKSKQVGEIFVFPGNDLMKLNSLKPVRINPEIGITAVDAIVKASVDNGLYLVDVAQEDSIAAGTVDALTEAGIIAIGPTKGAGRIEWDKAWARELGEEAKLLQPAVQVCHSENDAREFIASHPDQKWFIKASGLAQGKGVLPAADNEDALKLVKRMKQFGQAGETFLIESCLVGEEFSSFAFCDGETYSFIGSAQDNKRVNNFDEGENTGGMGALSSPLMLDEKFNNKVDDVLLATTETLKKQGLPYKGLVYFGGMKVVEQGEPQPYVVEFNSRWGDPEAQVIIPGIINDYFDIALAMHNGTLRDIKIETDGKVRVAVAGVSRGYPGDYAETNGKAIYGLDEASKVSGVKVYGSGVKMRNGGYYAHGGRLFYVVGEGDDVIEARQKAYEALSLVSVEGDNLHYRTDIGWRDVERLRKNDVNISN